MRYLRRCRSLLILLLLIFVDSWSNLLWENSVKENKENKRVSEKIWEPPIEIENSHEAATESQMHIPTESAYWFIPQASDCLISDRGKGTVAEYVFVSGRFGSRNL